MLHKTERAPHQERLSKRLNILFTKFDTKMKKCRNGSQSNTLHSKLSPVTTDTSVANVQKEWLNFFRTTFNNCDIPIIRKNENFDNTTWPKRISNWFNRLSRDLGRK